MKIFFTVTLVLSLTLRIYATTPYDDPDSSVSMRTDSQNNLAMDTATVSSNGQLNKASINKPKLIPLNLDTSGRGAINIHVSPEKSEVIVNTNKLGTGNQFVSDIPTGLYQISVNYNNRTKSEYVVIRDGETVNKTYKLSKKYHLF